MSEPIELEPLAGRGALRRFVGFPFDLYRGDPMWVPPIIKSELDAIDPERNPVFEFTEAAFWLARQGGKIVGRVAGFINRRDNERRGRRIARFGMIDFADDREVCAALLAAVEEWAGGQGMDEMEGPLGPGHFDRNCVLVDGFDQLPTAVSSYNYPYYAGHIEAYGYSKELDYLEHRIAIASEPDPRVGRIAERVLERKGLRLWQAPSKRALKARGREFFELINAAYSGLHDFVPLTDAEAEFLIGLFFGFVDTRLVKIVVDRDGVMVAAGLAMESFSKALQAARGKVWPLGWLRMLRAMRGNEVLDLYLVAVRPDLQGAGLNAILMHEMHKTAAARGLQWAESNGELETNEKIQSMWKGYEYRTHKRRRIYSKRIGD